MPSVATATVPRRLHRTRAGTPLPRVDGRLRSSRRFRELAEIFTREFGGNLSPVDQSQVHQLVTLTMAAEQLSADIAGGKAVDADTLIRVNSEARRVMEALRAKTAKSKPSAVPLRDVLRGDAG